MASLYIHGKNFISRLTWLSPLMGGILPTAKYLIKARGRHGAIGLARYNNTEFEFRNCDATALKEVLIDKEYSFLSNFLKSCPEPVVVDIGAHIGTFSLWLCHQNQKANILMVEANPESYKILVRNIGKIVPENQYKAMNKAAWKSNDVVKFTTTGDTMGNKVSPEGDIEINGITFAEIVEIATGYNARIDLMKIDIEGAEEAFFETTDDVLRKIERIVIELHPKACNTQVVREKLKKRYKNIREIPGRINAKPVLYCTNDY